MNVTKLILELKSKITDNTLDQQMISKAIKLLELGAVIQVDSFSELPNPSENTGRLYYVQFDGLYWSTGDFWVPIVKTVLDLTWAWGLNTGGRLGDGTTTQRSSPVSVVGGFTDWCQVSAGGFHSLGLRSNGTAWAWGYAGFGRLGDNTSTSKSSPVLVAGGFTDWCQVSAGRDHSLGLRSNGTVWAWGPNTSGQLSDATTTPRSSPVSVVGGFTDWCQVSAGANFSLGVRTNGTAWGWGANAYFGGTGDGTTENRSSPVSVIGGFTDWCFVAAIHRHALAIRTNGTMWAWGANSSGQLGSGLSGTQLSPVSVVGGFTDWCQAGGGGFHSLGVRSNGSLWAWGNNGSGRLGDGTTTNRNSPVSVVGGFTDWCQVSKIPEFIGNHSLGVRQNGTAWAWGSNSDGRLGDGTTTDTSSPVSVIGGFSDWCQVSAGESHSLALRKQQL